MPTTHYKGTWTKTMLFREYGDVVKINRPRAEKVTDGDIPMVGP